MDDVLDFYTYKDRYEEQLKTKEEQQQMNPEEMLDHLSDQMYFGQEFAGTSYKVHYANKEDFEEGQEVLTSNDALVKYYERTDPMMLEGLKSKSAINVCGKKSERKKLRKKYLEARSDKEMENAEAQKLYQDAVHRFNAERKAIDGHTFEYTVEKAKEDLKNKETEEIMGYFQTQNKDPEQLDQIRKKVSKLGYLRRQQLRTLAGKSMPVDADLNGVDNELVKEKQTEYAKEEFESKAATWEGYRVHRSAIEIIKGYEVPEEYEAAKRKEYNETHEKRIGDEFKNRTASVYMKKVEYVTKDGKQVPASKQDEENLQWNHRWIDSLYSDNKEDWDFRFEEMEKCIERAWADCLPLIKKVQDGTFDYKKDGLELPKFLEYNSQLLCVSGVSSDRERTMFTASSYYKKLEESRAKELDARYKCMTSLFALMGVKYQDMALNPTNMQFMNTTVDSSYMVTALFENIKDAFAKCHP